MVTDLDYSCQRDGHIFAITYGWRFRRFWWHKVLYLRCWACDLKIREP
jgi:hypothetical protein